MMTEESNVKHSSTRSETESKRKFDNSLVNKADRKEVTRMTARQMGKHWSWNLLSCRTREESRKGPDRWQSNSRSETGIMTVGKKE